MMADCSAARRPASRRIRRTDGPVGRMRTGEQAAEVSVGRYQDPLINLSALQDSRIRCCLHAKVPQVHGIMPHRLQTFGKQR
jgi:hypothetical protein